MTTQRQYLIELKRTGTCGRAECALLGARIPPSRRNGSEAYLPQTVRYR